VLFAGRWHHTGQTRLGFLLFNLLLAAIPLGLAVLASHAHQAGHARLAALLLAAGLLFLPNAPYVVSDLIHVRARPGVPLWYDAALFGSAALAGVVLGVAALREARGTLRAMVGDRATFVLLAFATLASGFGIYLGRFVRLNSWDALFHPRAVLSDVVPPLLDPVAFSKAWVVTLVFGSLFAVAYLAHPRDEREGLSH
jgi:uncharacterized membrane protein